MWYLSCKPPLLRRGSRKLDAARSDKESGSRFEASQRVSECRVLRCHKVMQSRIRPCIPSCIAHRTGCERHLLHQMGRGIAQQQKAAKTYPADPVSTGLVKGPLSRANSSAHVHSALPTQMLLLQSHQCQYWSMLPQACQTSGAVQSKSVDRELAF